MSERVRERVRERERERERETARERDSKEIARLKVVYIVITLISYLIFIFF